MVYTKKMICYVEVEEDVVGVGGGDVRGV